MKQLLSHEWYRASRCVCCYIPMAGKELDTYGLLRAVLGSGRQLVVPRVFGSGPAEMATLRPSPGCPYMTCCVQGHFLRPTRVALRSL